MRSLNSIETAFREMGLASDEDRKRFIPIPWPETEDEGAPAQCLQIFIRIAGTSALKGEPGAELGSDPRRD